MRPATRSTRTVTLQNGNRVTITLGWSKSSGQWKKVTVKRPNGDTETRTTGSNYFGFGGLFSMEQPDFSIPRWALN